MDVGITREGYDLTLESRTENIEESDAFGLTIIDLIYRGGTGYLMFESLAYKAGSTTPFWPYGSLGVIATSAAPIARLGSNIAASMVLTDVDATPAATFPATLTASKSILAPNNPARLLFNSKLRTVPVRLLLLPSESGGTVTLFTTT